MTRERVWKDIAGFYDAEDRFYYGGNLCPEWSCNRYAPERMKGWKQTLPLARRFGITPSAFVRMLEGLDSGWSPHLSLWVCPDHYPKMVVFLLSRRLRAEIKHSL